MSKTWKDEDGECAKHKDKRSLREVARHGDEVEDHGK